MTKLKLRGSLRQWLGCGLLLLGVLVLLHKTFSCLQQHSVWGAIYRREQTSGEGVVHLAAVSCGENVASASDLTLLLKSAVALSPNHRLHVHVFVDEEREASIRAMLKSWQQWRRFSFEVRAARYPTVALERRWRDVYKPCATLRLFMPQLLPRVQTLLYVDTDVLFLAPPERLWRQLRRLKPEQLVALAPAFLAKQNSLYNASTRHPFYPPLGLNTGVMLMSLARMRTAGWTDALEQTYKQYATRITMGDQDLINIVLQRRPAWAHVLGCRTNYRWHFCAQDGPRLCSEAARRGALLVHGTRGALRRGPQPFPLLRVAWLNYHPEKEPLSQLLLRIRRGLQKLPQEQCAAEHDVFTTSLAEAVEMNQTDMPSERPADEHHFD